MSPVPEEDRWRARVKEIISGVRRESWIYFALGLVSYIGAGITFIFAVKDPSLAALLIMGYFQLMVIFFGTMKIYPCIRGGFLVSVEQTYETIGDMQAIRKAIEKQSAPLPTKPRVVHEA
jgi:hypothetical protein